MLKKVLGLDVGIKNLAYCLIDSDNDKFKINKWMLVNIINSNLVVCSGKLKNGKICGKKGKFYYEENNTKVYYCKVHTKQHILDTDKIEKESISTTTNQLCSHLSTKDIICGKKALYTFENNPYCTVHKNMYLKNKIKDLSLKPIKKKKCTDLPPEKLCNLLYDKLSEIDFLKELTEINIENQPDLNNTMRGITSMLLSYFVYYKRLHNLDYTIRLVSPSMKINMDDNMLEFTKEYISKHDKTKRTNCKCRICKLGIEINKNIEAHKNELANFKFDYDSIKELGIIKTHKVLKDNNMLEYLSMIETHKKQDDLCDAFLHAYNKL